jgi:hypothetical protein
MYQHEKLNAEIMPALGSEKAQCGAFSIKIPQCKVHQRPHDGYGNSQRRFFEIETNGGVVQGRQEGEMARYKRV